MKSIISKIIKTRPMIIFHFDLLCTKHLQKKVFEEFEKLQYFPEKKWFSPILIYASADRVWAN